MIIKKGRGIGYDTFVLRNSYLSEIWRAHTADVHSKKIGKHCTTTMRDVHRIIKLSQWVQSRITAGARDDRYRIMIIESMMLKVPHPVTLKLTHIRIIN